MIISEHYFKANQTIHLSPFVNYYNHARKNEISIAQLLENFEADMQRYPDILDAIYANVKPLCETIQSILSQKENLRKADANSRSRRYQ